MAEDPIENFKLFLSLAGHELRAPLGAISMHVQLLKKELGGQQIRRLDLIASQVKRMARLIDSLLNSTQMERGEMTYTFKDYEIDQQLSEIVYAMQEEATAAGSPITLNIVYHHVPAYADPDRVEETIVNLIVNAIKYGEGKPLTVSLTTDEFMVKVSVTDQGRGISKDKLDKVFQRYARLDEHRGKPGLGLGLWLSNQIAQAHKGKIEVVSGPEGSTFALVLPYNRADLDPREVAPLGSTGGLSVSIRGS